MVLLLVCYLVAKPEKQGGELSNTRVHDALTIPTFREIRSALRFETPADEVT